MSLDEFDAIIGHAKRIVGTSRNLAQSVYPNGARLACAKCKHEQSASAEQVARYFSTGWPVHCNATMGATSV